jgi:hypothetical protein
MFNHKHFILLASLIVFCVSTLSAQDNSKTPSDAKIEFTEEAFDFGLMQPDSMYYHVFEFKNSGADTLKIVSVRPG